MTETRQPVTDTAPPPREERDPAHALDRGETSDQRPEEGQARPDDGGADGPDAGED